MKEKWQKIEGFPNYSVSNHGRIRNDKSGRIKKTFLRKKKYVRVQLHKNGTGYTRSVHRLAATAFLPNPENKGDVNHEDGVPQNNHISNLSWMTRSENLIHAYKTGLKEPAGFCTRSKPGD